MSLQRYKFGKLFVSCFPIMQSFSIRQLSRRLLAGILCLGLASCVRERPLDAAALRGLPLEQLVQMREDILSRHADGSPLSKAETADVEVLRTQERRLENAWIFGEWRERHGARLIFRDDGSVSVGARSGAYNELGVFMYVSPEQPAFESVWTLVYDADGNPVVLVPRPGAPDLLYPFHRRRDRVYEREGDLFSSEETGCYFVKIQN